MFDIPILLIVYKRKDTLMQILEIIQQINPKKLYIASDAPPKDKNEDIIKNNEVKEIIKNFSFKGTVFKNFQDENLGCGKGPKVAIDWFFEHEYAGIILEDDCLPTISFFHLCEALLLKYETNEKIMAISGNNYLLGNISISNSYYFTKYPNIWGWATWRRAWQKMDWEMKDYLKFLKNETLLKYTNSQTEYWHWKQLFDNLYNNEHKNDYWDYQWLYSIWNNKGIGIAPCNNLVKNIGFDTDATHTINRPKWYDGVLTEEIIKITHPSKIDIHQEADNFQFNTIIHPVIKPTTKQKVWNKLKSLKNKLFYQKLVWQDNEYFDPIWKDRIKKMAIYILPDDTVVDLGCGMMWLKESLTKTNIYIPVDYKQRDEETIVCDFNKNEFPDTTANIYFVSGCLEYIEQPDVFIKKIATYSNRCIISYCTLHLFPDLNVRKNLMWKNNLSEEEIVHLFNKYGFELKDKQTTDLKNQLFYFSK